MFRLKKIKIKIITLIWLLEKYLLVVLRFDDRIIFRNFLFRRQAVHAQSTLAADRSQTHSKY